MALFHSAQKVMEQHVVPREQKLASAEEYKKNALYQGRRRLTTPLPVTRTGRVAPVPQVRLPDLAGDVDTDAAMVAFLVRQTLLEREAEEERKRQEDLMRRTDEDCAFQVFFSQRAEPFRLRNGEWQKREDLAMLS